MTVASIAQKPTGIAPIGLHLPRPAMSIEELAPLRGAAVALHEPGDPGEPTPGAGGVAMVMDEPQVASIDPASCRRPRA